MLFNDIPLWYPFFWHNLIYIFDFNLLLHHLLPGCLLAFFSYLRCSDYLPHINPDLLLEPLINLKQTDHPSGMLIPILPLAQVDYHLLIC